MTKRRTRIALSPAAALLSIVGLAAACSGETTRLDPSAAPSPSPSPTSSPSPTPTPTPTQPPSPSPSPSPSPTPTPSPSPTPTPSPSPTPSPTPSPSPSPTPSPTPTGCAAPDPTPGAAGPCEDRLCLPGVGWVTVDDANLDGLPCDDGNPCTDGTTCSNARCAGGFVAPDPTPDAAGPCERRRCNPTDGWTLTPDPGRDDQPCDDGDLCTTDSSCAAGVCSGGASAPDPTPDAAGECGSRSCDPSLGWQSVADPTTEGQTCTPAGSCGAGTCEAGVCATDTDGPTDFCLARVPATTFSMGSPPGEANRSDNETVREVTLTRDLLVMTTEITQGLWTSVMGSSPHYFTGCGDDCPADQLSWYDAAAFCNALSARYGLPTCYTLDRCSGTPGNRYSCADVTASGGGAGQSCSGYRLPTEAEWELAARAGELGATYGPRSTIAWWWANNGVTYEPFHDLSFVGGSSRAGTHPVGGLQPNGHGIYDMLGNVAEWVWDWYAPDYGGTGTQIDPNGPASSSTQQKVVRGGAYATQERGIRFAARQVLPASSVIFGFGARCVRSVAD